MKVKMKRTRQRQMKRKENGMEMKKTKKRKKRKKTLRKNTEVQEKETCVEPDWLAKNKGSPSRNPIPCPGCSEPSACGCCCAYRGR